MKNNNNYFLQNRYKQPMDMDFDDYTEMFQEGLSDAEISIELGVDENYVRRLREEYQNDY